ncbi:MAG: glycerol-3-phosphate dehydrogenase, partial [Ruminiclostridium sp.]|nr:glycerol-3-phosphate dehydrogenase [Ruminiclostridium sp.]
TCTSAHSRNHRAGILIGEEIPALEAVQRVGTVEGYGCTKIAYEIANRLGVRVPIIEQLYKICYEGSLPSEAARALMGRPQRHEKEQFWNV